MSEDNLIKARLEAKPERRVITVDMSRMSSKERIRCVEKWRVVMRAEKAVEETQNENQHRSDADRNA